MGHHKHDPTMGDSPFFHDALLWALTTIFYPFYGIKYEESNIFELVENKTWAMIKMCHKVPCLFCVHIYRP